MLVEMAQRFFKFRKHTNETTSTAPTTCDCADNDAVTIAAAAAAAFHCVCDDEADGCIVGGDSSISSDGVCGRCGTTYPEHHQRDISVPSSQIPTTQAHRHARSCTRCHRHSATGCRSHTATTAMVHSFYWAALSALGVCVVVLDLLLLMYVNGAIADVAAMQADRLGGAVFSAEVRRLVRDETAEILLAASISNTASRVGSNDE